MSQYDVIILGSGISGLTSAALLSQKGKRVLVLEQHTKPGGYMHNFRRFGETFDTGAHYMGALGPGQPFRVLLEYMGVYDDSLFAPLDPDGFDEFHFPRGLVEIPCGYENNISHLSAIFPHERSAIEKYFSLVRQIVDYFPTYKFADRMEMKYPPEALDRSLRDVVESLTSHAPLKAVFYAYCSLHGVRPEDVAFGFHAIVTDSLVRGPYGLNGGGDALTEKFVSVIKKQGGEIHCRERVTSLAVDGRQVKTVITHSGAEYQAEWIISSLHPKATYRLLNHTDMFPPVFKDRLENIKESTGIFGLYATFKSRPNVKPNRNSYYFRSDSPDDMFASVNPGDTPPVVFVSSPKREWKSDEINFPMSFHAASPFEWFTPHSSEIYGRRSQDYKLLKARIRESILDAVETYRPGTRENLKAETSSTPLTHLHFNGSEEGSSYGIYHSMQNTGARALGPRTKILNLLLTGQNCLFPGLLGAATSALRTCGHVVGIKSILHELEHHGMAR